MNITIDLISAFLGLISSYYYIKEKPFAWLISLAVIPINFIIDIRIGIYGDLLLQLIYFFLLFHAWTMWRRNISIKETLPVNRLNYKQCIRLVLIASPPCFCIWFLLSQYTNSSIAILDAIVTVCSLLATWMLSRKMMESWLLWILVDILYVVIFTYKQIPFHGAMAVIDGIICIIGYHCWQKEYKNIDLKPTEAATLS